MTIIIYDIFVPIEGKPAKKKPDIKAYSKKEAKKIAKKLYGKDVIVIEPYDLNWK